MRAQDGLRSAALAMAAGLLYAGSQPPVGLPLLAWLAWAPFCLAVAGRSPLAGAGLGVLFGLTLEATLGSFLPGMLMRYFGLGAGAAWLAHAAHGLLEGGVPYGIGGAALAWASGRGKLGPATAAAVVGGVEMLRTAMPLADPYALTASSQVDLPVAQIAAWVGPTGVAMLVAATGAALAGLLRPGLGGPQRWRHAVCVAALVALAFGLGALRRSQGFETGPGIRVAVVQPALAAEDRKRPETRRARLERQIELTRSAPAPADLVFWPEFAVDFYLREPGPERELLRVAARQMDAELVLGGPHYRLDGAGADYFTSVFLLRDGEEAGRYDKRRLVPFAESAPFGPFLRARDAMYRPGREPRLLPSRRAAIGAFVCGEALFPSAVRELVDAGAGLLANPSNDAWFGDPAPAEHQLAVARLRAIESGRWLVRPTLSGVSAVVDPAGRVRARAGWDEEAVLEATVYARSERTLYQRLGDAPALAFTGAMLTLLAFGRRGGRS